MKKNLLLGILLASTGVCAFASTCMVLGDKGSRVKASEGERSPVFVTADCAALRLVDGKALASWIGRDGKPRMIPITKEGVEFAPQAGAEERSVTVVWNELTTKRERQQPAYMRNIGDERPPKVYVPQQGIVLFEAAENATDVAVESADGAVVYKTHVNMGQDGVIPREVLLPGQIYKVVLRRIESAQEWRWRTVSAEEMQSIDQSLVQIEQTVTDNSQSRLMRAMLFEQMKIRVNMDLTLQGLR